MSVIINLKAKLHQAIAKAVTNSSLASIEQLPEFVIETPKDQQNGDFASNIAMQLTKIAKKPPRQIAEQIVENIDQEALKIAKIEIAGPGFINFYMQAEFLHKAMIEIFEAGETYGSTNLGQQQKVQLEFVSANPTGNLHLGHARWAAIGDTLANIMSFAGYDVTREFYINDAGNQIDNLGLSLYCRYLQALGQEAEMPEGGYFGQDIIEMGQQLARDKADYYQKMEEKQRHEQLKSFALNQKLQDIKNDLQKFGVEFDVWFSERSLYQGTVIQDVLAKIEKSGYLYEKDGATWFASEKLGDDKDRVLVKSDGSFTYLTPDIAYHQNKFERGFTKVINIWGQDHHGYVARMKAAIAALGYEREQLVCLLGQLVNLYQDGEQVKMSKRTGKAVTMAELIEEVGVDATRYFFLMRGMDTHLDFDLDLARSQSNENPVFYVQYAHARICSIIRQITEQDPAIVDGFSLAGLDCVLLDSSHERQIMRKLADFAEEVNMAAEQLAPHRIVRYAFDLATLFHSFYGAVRVISDEPKLTAARYGLVLAVRQVLINVLKLMGVSNPDKM